MFYYIFCLFSVFLLGKKTDIIVFWCFLLLCFFFFVFSVFSVFSLEKTEEKTKKEKTLKTKKNMYIFCLFYNIIVFWCFLLHKKQKKT